MFAKPLAFDNNHNRIIILTEKCKVESRVWERARGPRGTADTDLGRSGRGENRPDHCWCSEMASYVIVFFLVKMSSDEPVFSAKLKDDNFECFLWIACDTWICFSVSKLNNILRIVGGTVALDFCGTCVVGIAKLRRSVICMLTAKLKHCYFFTYRMINTIFSCRVSLNPDFCVAWHLQQQILTNAIHVEFLETVVLSAIKWIY